MMKKNDSGITLITLIITIIVLIILASIGITSGISTIRSSRLTKFTTEMKIMQLKVNELYDSYINDKSVTVGSVEYVGKGKTVTNADGTQTEKPGIQEIGEDISIFSDNRLQEIFSEEGSGITSTDGYMYYDTDTLQELNVDGVDNEFFVNIATRSVVSIEGFNYYGKKYYTLEQLPEGLYNVDYEANQGKPTFDISAENTGANQWKITISNIQYDGNISKWDVKYQLDGSDYWNTSEDMSFIVDREGTYNIYIQNGDIQSDTKNKAVGVKEPTPEDSNAETLQEMRYGVIEIAFLDNTGYAVTDTANAPILKTSEGMSAVYWAKDSSGEIDETNIKNNTYEIVSNDTSALNKDRWYNYTAQSGETTESGSSRWANAKVTKDGVDSYYVWIPRYAYRIIYFNTETNENQYRSGDLTEEEALAEGYIVGYSDARGIVDAQGKKPTGVASQTAISVNDKYFKTHPVFDGDVNYGGWADDNGTPVKLQGIWVAKYESSHSDTVGITQGSSTTIKSVPGVSSWRSILIGDMYTYSKEYNTNLESHLMKNSEWGAVAYLTHSKYGRNGTEITINSNSDFYTGGGSGTAYINNIAQSSTGNVYGIYDLSGGAYEYVAAYYKNGDSDKLNNGSAFTTTKVSDTYSTSYEGDNAINSYKYGDATYETSAWNEEIANFVKNEYPFLKRGAGNGNNDIAGVFSFDGSEGISYSGHGFRTCLTVN